MKNRLSTAGIAVLAALVFVACSEGGDPLSPDGVRFSHSGPTANEGHWILCKEGTSATFDVDVDGAMSTVSLDAGECTELVQIEVTPGQPSPSSTVTVTEQPATGIQLTQIMVERWELGTKTTQTLTGTNTVTETIDDDIGVVATFFNEPVGGGEGCTPGYWRQPQHFDSWVNHAPSDPFAGVFDLPSSLNKPETLDPGMTLLDGLTLRGGGVNALIRHAVAALLNAESGDVSYDLGPGEVVTAFNDAISGGDVEQTKDMLEGFNEQGCPLD